MKSFATLSVLAISASAVNISQEEVVIIEVGGDYHETFDMLPDAAIAEAMAQGTGRDHTDWSWHREHNEAWDEMADAAHDEEMARLGLVGAQLEYAGALSQVLAPQVEFQRNCQLHREEEIDLYYQCTQNDINNYALHHFGGNKRSYPRWVEEYNVCIDHIHSAKHLHLDFTHENGEVTLEPCAPQTHSSTVYIGAYLMPTVVYEQGTILTADPLNPHDACERQSIPDWSGLWIEIFSEAEAMAIFMGKQEVNSNYAERCYTVEPTRDPKQARLLETWDEEEPEPRDYDVTLRSDKRRGENGCMVHTHLKGTEYSQWVTEIPNTGISMNRAIQEDWYKETPEGESVFDKTHYEVRIGGCHNSEDGKRILEKHYLPGIHGTELME